MNFGKTSGTAKNRFALCFRQNHKVGKIKKCTKEKAYPKGYAVSESSKCNGNDRRPNGDNHRDNGDVAAVVASLPRLGTLAISDMTEEET